MRGATWGLAILAALTGPALAVVGSTQNAADFSDRVVMVLQRSGRTAGFCTGIVVAPSAVLTAAHCVPPGADLRIHYRGPDGQPVLLEVAGVARHPGYRSDAIARRERSIDLAVVRLATPLPQPFRPATLSATAALAAGAPVRLLGFGVAREGDGATSGTLRAASLTVRRPLSTVLLWAEDPAGHGAGACTGDSGGPVIGQESDEVLALTLWASGEGRHACGSLTQALWLAPYRDWIAEAAAP